MLTLLNNRYVVPEIDHALRVSGAVLLLYHRERLADVEASELAGTLPLGLIRFEEGTAAAEPASGGHRLLSALMAAPPWRSWPSRWSTCRGSG